MRLNTDRAIAMSALDLKRTYSEEASTLGFHSVYRLWDDAADEGVWLTNRVGELLAFALTEVQRDCDGDIKAWRFEHSDRQPRAKPGAPAPLALIIWNE